MTASVTTPTHPSAHELEGARAFTRAEAAHGAQLPPAAGGRRASAEGAWMTDVDGRRYLDLLAGYSALNFGHRHPGLMRAAHAQLDRLTLTSRAFVHDQFADFAASWPSCAARTWCCR